jgi:hypothetical protein
MDEGQDSQGFKYLASDPDLDPTTGQTDESKRKSAASKCQKTGEDNDKDKKEQTDKIKQKKAASKRQKTGDDNEQDENEQTDTSKQKSAASERQKPVKDNDKDKNEQMDTGKQKSAASKQGGAGKSVAKTTRKADWYTSEQMEKELDKDRLVQLAVRCKENLDSEKQIMDMMVQAFKEGKGIKREDMNLSDLSGACCCLKNTFFNKFRVLCWLIYFSISLLEAALACIVQVRC